MDIFRAGSLNSNGAREAEKGAINAMKELK